MSFRALDRLVPCLSLVAGCLVACSSAEPSETADVGGAGGGGLPAGGTSSVGDAGAAQAGTNTAGVTAAGTGGSVASAGAGGIENMGGDAGQGGAQIPMGSGTITYERWDNIPGETVDLVPVNQPPDATMELNLFQIPIDVSEDYAARVRGYLTAPETGQYTFWISSDDNSELNLSTDESPANKVRIAYISGMPAWTDYEEWDKFETQMSEPVSLMAGQRYYIEALLKEDIAEDHLAVGWTKPGESGDLPAEIIPGKHLSPMD